MLTWSHVYGVRGPKWLHKEMVTQVLRNSSVKRKHRSGQKGHFWMQLPGSEPRRW